MNSWVVLKFRPSSSLNSRMPYPMCGCYEKADSNFLNLNCPKTHQKPFCCDTRMIRPVSDRVTWPMKSGTHQIYRWVHYLCSYSYDFAPLNQQCISLNSHCCWLKNHVPNGFPMVTDGCNRTGNHFLIVQEPYFCSWKKIFLWHTRTTIITHCLPSPKCPVSPSFLRSESELGVTALSSLGKKATDFLGVAFQWKTHGKSHGKTHGKMVMKPRSMKKIWDNEV